MVKVFFAPQTIHYFAITKKNLNKPGCKLKLILTKPIEASIQRENGILQRVRIATNTKFVTIIKLDLGLRHRVKFHSKIFVRHSQFVTYRGNSGKNQTNLELAYNVAVRKIFTFKRIKNILKEKEKHEFQIYFDEFPLS